MRERLAAEPRGLEVAELAERTGFTLGATTEALWALVWRGEATCSSLRPLRQGIENGFRVEEVSLAASGGGPGGARGTRDGRGGRRGLFRRWQGSPTAAGRWRALPAGAAIDANESGAAGDPRASTDPIVEEERRRERARLLLDRYGVVFRELLAASCRRWRGAAWRAPCAVSSSRARSSPVASSTASPACSSRCPEPCGSCATACRRRRSGGARRSTRRRPAASTCRGCKGALPRRSASTRLVYRGSRLSAVLARGGREIQFSRRRRTIRGLAQLLEPLRSALTRAVDPERSIDVETINDQPAGTSPYFAAFAAFECTRDGGLLRLRRRYASRDTGER